MTATVHIELTAPQSVNGRRAGYQPLWLLVRLYYARRYEAAAAILRLAELRQQFTDARSLRMFISRAFRDFAQWGVHAGWGEDTHGDPRFLNPDRRSQGPFWLPEGEAAKIACTVDGRPASQAELLRFLDVKRKPAAASAGSPMSVDFWFAYAGAQQQLRHGRLLASLNENEEARRAAGALAGFKDAARNAGNRLQHALAALGETQVWRRLDDLEAARKTLAQLRRMLKEGGADEGGYLDAMEQILSAWCAYSERDLALTEALLTAMRQAEPRASVVRHHPRIRFEWNNLMALVRRTQALAAGAPAAREEAAIEAMRLFAAALDSAFEIGSFDAAQQAAANAGMATWLFAGEGLGAQKDALAARTQALRWLVLSEWLCQCAGAAGQSAWNAIYLMRIARGHCDAGNRPSVAAFRALQPLTPAQAVAGAGMTMRIESLCVPDWLSLAERMLASPGAERRYGLLQRCSLRLEHAWYAAHAGALATAAASFTALEQEVGDLPASDRSFFQFAFRKLPAELHAG